MGVDRDWLLDKLTDKFGSLRKAAPHFEGRRGKPMNASSLSRLINRDEAEAGKEPTAYELFQISRLLEVPMDQVASRLGLTDRWKKWKS